MREPAGSSRRARGVDARHSVPLDDRPAAGRRDPRTLRALLAEDGHEVDRQGRVRCLNPAHDDNHPSAVVYDDRHGGHAFCFACGHCIDAFMYLVEHRNVSRRTAFQVLGGNSAPTLKPRARPQPSASNRGVRSCPTTPLPERVRRQHEERVAKNQRLPAALGGRGFTYENLAALGIAQVGEAAVLGIAGPDGQLLRLKRRSAPNESGARYRYTDADGDGTPAWCSPNFGRARIVLVVEGELNGMAAWLARPDLDVVGVAGVAGSLPLPALVGRSVVLHADGDEPGRAAVRRWTAALAAVGCRVSILPPWPDGDACDVAGKHGRAELRRRLT